MICMHRTVKNLEEMQNLASSFVQNISSNNNFNNDSATIVTLSGDLGAGKTTFTQGVAKALGVTENLVSPTFVIMKFYELDYDVQDKTGNNIKNNFKHLIHIDAYRLESGKELLSLGWEKIISDKENLILLEWPERVAEIIPEGVVKIKFEHKFENNIDGSLGNEGDTEREVEIVI